MNNDQSGSPRLLEVKINASKIPIEKHEEYLWQRQRQIKRLAKYVLRKKVTDRKSLTRQLAKTICCGRVLVEAATTPAVEINITGQPEPKLFRWAYACRQNQWCSRCSAIERESRAVRFARAATQQHHGDSLWGVVISPKKPTCVQELIDRANQSHGILRSLSRNIIKAPTAGVKLFSAGLHTKPQPYGLLWPHIHMLLVTTDSKTKPAVRSSVLKWLDALSVNNVHIEIRRLGDVGFDIALNDIKHLYQYITRRDDPDDDEIHPAVRAAVFDKLGITKSYAASSLPKNIELRRAGFPNASVARKTRKMLALPVAAENMTFTAAYELTPNEAAEKLISTATDYLKDS